jgi:hypothetical protein
MICFLDFEPRQLEAPGLFKGARMEDLDTVLADLNAWVAKNGAEVISIETVVLPNIHRPPLVPRLKLGRPFGARRVDARAPGRQGRGLVTGWFA